MVVAAELVDYGLHQREGRLSLTLLCWCWGVELAVAKKDPGTYPTWQCYLSDPSPTEQGTGGRIIA